MTKAIFIGDEVTASAYRLVGLDTRIPEGSDVRRMFEAAMAESELLVITSRAAMQLPADRLRVAIRRAEPLILVVPDAAGSSPLEELDRRVDRVLGIEQ